MTAEKRSSKKKGETTSTPSKPSTEPKHDNKKEKHFKFEFGGPIGTTLCVFMLPLVIYALYFLCNDEMCLSFDVMSFDWATWKSRLPSLQSLITRESLIMYLGWMGFHVLCERILPGESVQGVELPNKTRLSYVMSGHLQFWVTLVAMGHAVPYFSTNDGVINIYGFGPLKLELIYDHYVGLSTVSIIGAAILSVYLYVSSFIPSGKILAHGGNTGYLMYDFFIGRELNPRIGSLDLKEFCELRPGLIGWMVINLGMSVKQFKKRALLMNHGSISASMLLINLFQGFYVWDALYNEKAILTTMDITTDGFGYMLAFGDLAWVPFIYSCQARYLVDHDPNLPLWQIGVISAIHFLGYFIFRSANSEKDAFRRDPNAEEVKHLKFMNTKRGTKLLTSGWWGSARKINYTGDWLVTLSWCLLCGFDSPIPYFQAIYFLILLVHRAIRDDEMCAEKYGDDWAEYKKKVPYMFIPYVI